MHACVLVKVNDGSLNLCAVLPSNNKIFYFLEIVQFKNDQFELLWR